MMDGSGIDPFLQDVLTGLARDQKTVPSRWLYDARGSRLFDDITELDEYYPTRTELTILNEQAAAIAEAIGPDAVIVEYGAGSLLKVRILLDALERPKAFVPVDISSEHLKGAADELKSVYGDLDVYPVAADFMDTNLGSNLPSGGGRRAGFFPGSTMGNLLDKDIDSFLRTTREDLGDGACFIIGLDQPKSPDILVPAYDDAKGVTADFNLNLLRRINRELGGNFDLDSFEHEARWNSADSRIEMHLRSLKAQSVEVAGRIFEFEKGETIHTENSRKIALDRFAKMAESAGWELTRKWTDAKGLFAVVLLEAR